MSDDHACVTGRSAVIQELRADLDFAARSSANVLLTGPHGVGKTAIARLIHQMSVRRHRPFVQMDCAELAYALLQLESTDDRQQRAVTDAALLEAHGGTLLVTDLQLMSPYTQTALVRFLDAGAAPQPGAREPVNVRVMASTITNLMPAIASETFREDLFYRLNMIHLTIPPVQARREDIPLLVTHFLRIHADAAGRALPAVSSDAMVRLAAYGWPGNLREMRGLLEPLAVSPPDGMVIGPEHLPDHVATAEPGGGAAQARIAGKPS